MMELLIEKLKADKKRLVKRMDRLAEEKEKLQGEIVDIEDEYFGAVDYVDEINKAIKLLEKGNK